MCTCGEVVAQHVTLYAPERGNDRSGLVNNIEAVPAIMDHLLKSSNLTFDAAKPWYLTRVIDGVMFRVLLGHIDSRNRLAAVAYGAVALSQC